MTELRSGDARETYVAQRGLAVLLKVYGDVGAAKMLEAEELICRALELREEAKAIFNRAERLANGYAAKHGDQRRVEEWETLPDYGIDW